MIAYTHTSLIGTFKVAKCQTIHDKSYVEQDLFTSISFRSLNYEALAESPDKIVLPLAAVAHDKTMFRAKAVARIRFTDENSECPGQTIGDYRRGTAGGLTRGTVRTARFERGIIRVCKSS